MVFFSRILPLVLVFVDQRLNFIFHVHTWSDIICKHFFSSFALVLISRTTEKRVVLTAKIFTAKLKLSEKSSM